MEKNVFKSRITRVLIMIGFFVTLFFVESDVCGSQSVGHYNQGFGTFDMKEYDYETVIRVLEQYEPGGREAAYRYYMVDFIFLLFFGAVQLISIDVVYSKTPFCHNKYLYRGIMAVPIARGICDLLENILLTVTISGVWEVNRYVVTTASIFTKCKLTCIVIWSIVLALGIVYRVLNCLFGKEKKLG